MSDERAGLVDGVEVPPTTGIAVSMISVQQAPRAVFEQLCRDEPAVGELTARFDPSQPAILQIYCRQTRERSSPFVVDPMEAEPSPITP